MFFDCIILGGSIKILILFSMPHWYQLLCLFCPLVNFFYLHNFFCSSDEIADEQISHFVLEISLLSIIILCVFLWNFFLIEIYWKFIFFLHFYIVKKIRVIWILNKLGLLVFFSACQLFSYGIIISPMYNNIEHFTKRRTVCVFLFFIYINTFSSIHFFIFLNSA